MFDTLTVVADCNAGFQCNSRDIKFHDKQTKLIRDGVSDKGDIELGNSKPRYDVKVKPYDMQKHVVSQMLAYVLKDAFVNQHLEKYLRRLNLFNLTISTERHIYQTLVRLYDEKWADTLLGYIVKRTNGFKMENHRDLPLVIVLANRLIISIPNLLYHGHEV